MSRAGSSGCSAARICSRCAKCRLPNGRRADLMAIDGRGGLTIVEIKVAKADLVGDCKWLDYLDYCDRFYWAVPPSLASILEEERYLPGAAGLIVADRYDAAIVRDAAAPAAGSGAAQGRIAAFRAPRGAAPVGPDRSVAGRGQLRPAGGLGLLVFDQLDDVARARVARRIVARRKTGDMIGLVGIGAGPQQRADDSSAGVAGPQGSARSRPPCWSHRPWPGDRAASRYPRGSRRGQQRSAAYRRPCREDQDRRRC